jgi:hypothetical protein
MDENKCNSCENDEVFVTITSSNDGTVFNLCFDCYADSIEDYNGIED